MEALSDLKTFRSCFCSVGLSLIESGSSGLYKPSDMLNIELNPKYKDRYKTYFLNIFLGVKLSLSYYTKQTTNSNVYELH